VATQNDAASADRFLKLLVAQMQNQDPLIRWTTRRSRRRWRRFSTVDGISQLNGTVKSLNTQFVQMQTLQGASLVGRDVTVAGNQLAFSDGKAEAGFELAGSASSVSVEVRNAAGHLVDTVALGALGSGRHGFDWDASGVADPTGYTFKVSASQGTAAVGRHAADARPP